MLVTVERLPYTPMCNDASAILGVMKHCYKPKNFTQGSLDLIAVANQVIEDYQRRGFSLTVRQLYYQFVARDYLANTEQNYNCVVSIVNDGRLAGLIDWTAIEDRTRYLRDLAHWESPRGIIESAAHGYRIDKWGNQKFRLEVWIEKDALIGVIESVCQRNDVPHFSCRGYTSASEMWVASQRLEDHSERGQTPVILHLGDHDPSGMDMTRDISDRLKLFMGRVSVERIALNMDQIQQFSPPPNPAKITDSRAKAYIAEYGADSWELDALDPPYLSSLIQDFIDRFRDADLWEQSIDREEQEKAELLKIAENYDGTGS